MATPASVTIRARRYAPKLLQRRPRPLPDADSPETRAEADRVREAVAWIDEPERIDSAAILDPNPGSRDSELRRLRQHVEVVEDARARRRRLPVESRLRDAQHRSAPLVSHNVDPSDPAAQSQTQKEQR